MVDEKNLKNICPFLHFLGKSVVKRKRGALVFEKKMRDEKFFLFLYLLVILYLKQKQFWWYVTYLLRKLILNIGHFRKKSTFPNGSKEKQLLLTEDRSLYFYMFHCIFLFISCIYFLFHKLVLFFFFFRFWKKKIQIFCQNR